MDRWVVRGVPASLEKSRKRHQEDEQEKAIAQARREQDAKAAVAAEALELRWPWTPLKRKVGAPTYDDLYEKELVHCCQHLATSESPPCLPPTRRPCTWHPKSGPRAWEFGSPAAAAAWAVGTAHPEGPQEGAETVTGEARTGESQVVKSEHLRGESGDEGQGPEADAKPDRKGYAKRISSTIKAWYLSFQAVKERDGWTRARVLRFASSTTIFSGVTKKVVRKWQRRGVAVKSGSKKAVLPALAIVEIATVLRSVI